MLRYCTFCKKDYDFAPLAVSGKKDIICPSCGRVIDKNSRHPVSHAQNDQIEAGIGNAVASIWHMAYVFYIFFAIIGFIGYIFRLDYVLYVATLIVILAYIIQLCTGTLRFITGIIFIPLGAIAGYFIFGSINGALLGVHVVFFLRHICRDILYRLIAKLIKAGN